MNESVERKAWWNLPGEVYDDRGIPIYPGDLLRTPHFIGVRGKRYYLYHTAVFVHGYMEMVPTSHLQPEKVRNGGRCLLTKEMAANARIIHGCGPESCIDYDDRPRRKPPERPCGNGGSDAPVRA